MNLLDSEAGIGVAYKECIKNIQSGDFSYFDKLLENEEKNDNTNDNKITFENKGSKIVASRFSNSI